ncbi:IS701 family transposase [Corallococcus exiguus]
MRERLARELEERLPEVEALVVDDTGFPKKGKHSVGVARQYSGTLGRTDNCQVAVSLHLAGARGSGCIGMRLYLPEEWATDKARRKAAGVPEEVCATRKWELALSQLDDALTWGVRKHVVLADAGYGNCREFREGLTARGLPYLVAVPGQHKVWHPGATPHLPVKKAGAYGRPRTRFVDDSGVQPWTIEELARQLPEEEYRRISWREGSRGTQASTFAAVRIQVADGHVVRKAPGAPEWLVCEWPPGEAAPTKYYLSSLPEDTPLKRLVTLAKLRWRIEHDYQEMKGEVGLDHFEGRTWRGFHHHATLCMVAHGFLALRRALFPPEEDSLDAAPGASTASASAAAPPRPLSAVPPQTRRSRSSSRTVTHLIK